MGRWKHDDFSCKKSKINLNLSLQIFEMMDAKARQDCIKEIDLLKVKLMNDTVFLC